MYSLHLCSPVQSLKQWGKCVSRSVWVMVWPEREMNTWGLCNSYQTGCLVLFFMRLWDGRQLKWSLWDWGSFWGTSGWLCAGCLHQFPLGQKKCYLKPSPHEVGGEINQSHPCGSGDLFVSDTSFDLCKGISIVCIRHIQAGEPLETSQPARRADVIVSSCLTPPSPRKG